MNERGTRATFLSLLEARAAREGYLDHVIKSMRDAQNRGRERHQRWAQLLALGITPPEWMINPIRRNIDYQASNRRTFLVDQLPEDPDHGS